MFRLCWNLSRVGPASPNRQPGGAAGDGTAAASSLGSVQA
ncbi:hypothetical protein Z950_3435 [Sulfitobacter mediterraneus KCTC 32188]|nr:hypothetical protein Z950_3435 [Sulfitobacter mediterraneus KCTC 32188]